MNLPHCGDVENKFQLRFDRHKIVAHGPTCCISDGAVLHDGPMFQLKKRLSCYALVFNHQQLRLGTQLAQLAENVFIAKQHTAATAHTHKKRNSKKMDTGLNRIRK